MIVSYRVESGLCNIHITNQILSSNISARVANIQFSLQYFYTVSDIVIDIERLHNKLVFKMQENYMKIANTLLFVRKYYYTLLATVTK